MNPYVWNEVNPELCYGRDALLSELLSGLPGSPRFSYGLAGGRRMGKSTILRRVELELKAGIPQWQAGGLRVIPIYVDGLALPRPLTADEVWGYLWQELQRALSKSPSSIEHSIDFVTFKEEIHPILTNLPERPRVVVLFDEIEPIAVCEWAQGFLAHWRALLSNTPGLSEYFTAVFAGAHELAILQRDIGSPLKDILEWRSLRCLELEDACKLMQEPIEREWPRSFLELVYEETGGQPFLLQYIMQQVCSTPTPNEETLQTVVAQAIKKFAKERHWQFSEWWERYCTPAAQRVYNRLPDDGSTLPLRALTREFGSDAAHEALEILQHVGIVAAEDDGFAFRYTGEMFRRWYRANFVEEEEEIKSLLANRESSALEFKSSARWDYRQNALNKELEKVVVKEIAGFLNAGGGKLLIGIDDNHAVLGLEKDYQTLKKKDRDGYELFITQLVSNYIGKEFCSYLRIAFQEVDEQDICLISVEAGPKPAYAQEGNEAKFYLRTGNSTQQLNTKEAIDYMATHWDKD